MALLLFGGALRVVHEEGLVLIDDWIRIRAAAPTAVLVKRLRAALDALLEKRIRDPEVGSGVAGSTGELIGAIVKLLNDEERSRAWM